jgi:gliding motility-associated-like protein
VLIQSDYTDFDQVQEMHWDFDDGKTGITLGSVNHEFTQEGLYYPSLTITDIHGCVFTDSTQLPVNVWPTPFASFSVDPPVAILPNTTFDFTNHSVNGTDFHWTFGDYGESTATDTTFTYPAETPGKYLVGLVALSNYGCADSTYRQIIVRNDLDVYIPNSFTPDYDGINDVWLIKGKGYDFEGYHMMVFNRSGEVVFDSTDPLQGWTGGHQNGTFFSPDGVYLYRCTMRDLEYEVSHLFEGHVTLLR